MFSSRSVGLVIPVYNEEKVLPYLFERLKALLLKIPRIQEVIFVDDGSQDKTLELLVQQSQKNPAYRVIRLSRNFGKQIGCLTGVRAVTSDAAVILDADLQDPPELIETMMREWDQGWDVVYSVRRSRVGDSWRKKVTAATFYRLLDRFTSFKIPMNAGDFRLIDKKVIEVLRKVHEQNPYFLVLVAWAGFRQKAIPYDRDRRVSGNSKFTFNKLIRLALDGFTGYATLPFYWVALIGFLTLGMSFVGGGVAVIFWLLGPSLSSTVIGLLGFFFLFSFQLICLGVLGEYLQRVLSESKKRPQMLVEYDSATDSQIRL